MKTFEGSSLKFEEKMEDDYNLKLITIGHQTSEYSYKLVYYYSRNEI